MTISRLFEIKNNFLNELKRASIKENSSLSFIINNIPTTPIVKENEIFKVLVIGGSVYVSAKLKKKASGINILEKINGDLPIFHTKEDFLNFVLQFIATDIEVYVFNFAYPLEPIFENEMLDGRLISGTKEHSFEGLIGEKIGDSVENFIKVKLNQDIKVNVANDTICLLLSGLNSNYKIHAAGIVGTGVNFALFLDPHTVVNLESANFDKFSANKSTQIIDKDSALPGKALFEKEVAGGYLYKRYNIEAESKGIKTSKLSSTLELNSIAKGKDQASILARQIFEHSAQLLSTQIAGIIEFLEETGMIIDSKANFVMDGSLFWNGYLYKQTVEKTLKYLLTKYETSFVKANEPTIIGAAKLVS